MRDAFAHIDEEFRRDGSVSYTAQVFRCSVPGCQNAAYFKKQKIRKPPEQLAKMATNNGWKIDLKKGQHLCPTDNEETVLKTPELTVELRRKIFREIDDCYDDKKTSYVLDVTDQSIASKLNTVWGLVAKVREENFGPAGPNPEIAKMEKDLTALALKAQAAEDSALRAAQQAEEATAEVAALRKRLEGMK